MGKYVLCFWAPLYVNGNSGGPLTPWERMWPECNSHNKHIFSLSLRPGLLNVASSSEMCHNGWLVFCRYSGALLNSFFYTTAFSCLMPCWMFFGRNHASFPIESSNRGRAACNHLWLALCGWHNCQTELSLFVYTAGPEAHFGKMASNDFPPSAFNGYYSVYPHTQAFKEES